MEDKYRIGEVSLAKIRNRNELRVIKIMPEILAEFPDAGLASIDYEDIYALTLNRLPSRYVQASSVVIQEPVTKEIIRKTLREVIQIIIQKPNYEK